MRAVLPLSFHTCYKYDIRLFNGSWINGRVVASNVSPCDCVSRAPWWAPCCAPRVESPASQCVRHPIHSLEQSLTSDGRARLDLPWVLLVQVELELHMQVAHTSGRSQYGELSFRAVRVGWLRRTERFGVRDAHTRHKRVIARAGSPAA